MSPKALWCTGSKSSEVRPAEIGKGVLVQTLFSGISRGTERLVFEGRVPESEWLRMRAPNQEGEFSFPVKFGYCAVGRVSEGVLVGKEVFALYPHQDSFRLSENMLYPLPKNLPAERAVLAANMETALNVLWDSGASAGDRIAVIGAGVLGSLVGYLAAKLPGAEVTLIDLNPAREKLATKLACSFALPDDAPADCDVVIHTSASGRGLSLALEIAGQEATVLEASWFGSDTVNLSLGAAFHSKRLRIISSQVGSVPAARTPRWTHQRRILKALDLLCDPVLDVLISGESNFSDLPEQYGRVLSDPETLCHRIRYETN
jgi:threonine dehydrogenase-like Zn-dependent dehydrogenase